MSIAELPPQNGTAETIPETTSQQPTAPAQPPAKPLAPPREKLIVHDNGPLAHLFDTGRFEQLQRLAMGMAAATLIPDHLRCTGSGRDKVPLSEKQIAANCFLIVNQAVRWGLDPFLVAPETYVVGGKLGFQGKLIAALINAKAGLKERLRYNFSGRGPDRTVTVVGTFEGEELPRTIDLVWKDAKTDNQMWNKDPDQKLIYSAVTKWARRHCPEIMLGVLTDDDLERIEQTRDIGNRDVTPGRVSRSPLNDRLGIDSQDREPSQGPIDPDESSDPAPESAGEEPQEREPTEAEMSQEDLLKESIHRVSESTAKYLAKIEQEYAPRLGIEAKAELSKAIDARRVQLQEAKGAKGGSLLPEDQ